MKLSVSGRTSQVGEHVPWYTISRTSDETKKQANLFQPGRTGFSQDIAIENGGQETYPLPSKSAKRLLHCSLGRKAPASMIALSFIAACFGVRIFRAMNWSRI